LLWFDVEDDPGQGAGLYEAIVSQDVAGLGAGGWADRLEALQRVKSRVAALEVGAIAGFEESLGGVSADLGHRRPEPGDRAAVPGERRWVAGELRSVADELALILNVGKGYATSRVHTACELVHNFSATVHALREGWLTERAAFTIVNELSVLDDLDEIHAAEAAVLAWARGHLLTGIKQECRREAAGRCPAASDRRHRRAHGDRSVRMVPDGDGRATLVHDHDVIDAAAAMASLTRSAARRRRNGDQRTMDQLRSDIALDRLLRGTNRTRTTPTGDTAVRRDTGGTGDEQTGRTCHQPANPTNEGPADNNRKPAPATGNDSGDTPGDESTDTTSHQSAPSNSNSNEPLGDCSYDFNTGDVPLADDPPDDPDYEPAGGYPTDDHPFGHHDDERPFEPHNGGDLGHSHLSHGDLGQGVDLGGGDLGNDGGVTGFVGIGGGVSDDDAEVLDEAAIGAQATVVIHATGAELAALIKGQTGTGGEADHHGPIPQNSLRKHLITIITNTLLPNLPTTPNSHHRGATTRRPRTTPNNHHPNPTHDPRTTTDSHHSDATHGPSTTADSHHPGATQHPRTTADSHHPGATHEPGTTADANASQGASGGVTADRGDRTTGAGARIELRITDQPPPSDPDRYTPSAALDRYVRLRDRTCQFPGCNRPAEFTDLDHRVPFAAGGRTTADNLWGLCRHHHRLKHEGGWQTTPNPDGSWTWTSPTGRPYRNNPTNYDPPEVKSRGVVYDGL
jgi:hypothetical protein